MMMQYCSNLFKSSATINTFNWIKIPSAPIRTKMHRSISLERLKLPSPSTLSVILISWPPVNPSGGPGLLACGWWLLVKPWPFRTGRGSTIVGSGTGQDSWLAESVIFLSLKLGLYSLVDILECWEGDKGLKSRRFAVRSSHPATGAQRGEENEDGPERRWRIYRSISNKPIPCGAAGSAVHGLPLLPRQFGWCHAVYQQIRRCDKRWDLFFQAAPASPPPPLVPHSLLLS